MNVWMSLKGVGESAFKGEKFPYEAFAPSLNKKVLFTHLNDVYDELMRLYDISVEKGFDVGESLFEQSYYFTDPSILVEPKYQTRIKEYVYCKKFSCPPYPSLYETPYEIIEDFMTIDEEYEYSRKEVKNE